MGSSTVCAMKMAKQLVLVRVSTMSVRTITMRECVCCSCENLVGEEEDQP